MVVKARVTSIGLLKVVSNIMVHFGWSSSFLAPFPVQYR
jgi:hypothetical protein